MSEFLNPEARQKLGGIIVDEFKSSQFLADLKTANKEEFERITKMINDANVEIAAQKKHNEEQKELIEKLSSQNDKLSSEINAQVTKSQPKHLSIEEAIYAAVEAKKEEVQAVIKGKQDKPLVFELRNTKAVDMATSTGTLTQTLTQNTGIISRIRHREERYLSVAAPGSIGANRALWVEEQDEQGVPVFIAEGTTKTKVSVKYVEQTAPVKKIAIYGKVTTEMLDDLPQFISYVQNNMTKRLAIATEDELIGGDGTGNHLFGLTYYAEDFDAGALASQVEKANYFDVFRAIALQVELGYGMANAIFINPADWAKAQLIKDADGRLLWKDYEVSGTGKVVVNGMEIISTTAMDAGSFAGGDMTVANVLYRQGLTVTVGLSGDDFINNMKTILVEQRLVQFVSGNDVQCLVKGDFTTAIAALNKES